MINDASGVRLRLLTSSVVTAPDRARAWCGPRNGQTVSQSVISRSRPALTPPLGEIGRGGVGMSPARSPAKHTGTAETPKRAETGHCSAPSCTVRRARKPLLTCAVNAARATGPLRVYVVRAPFGWRPRVIAFFLVKRLYKRTLNGIWKAAPARGAGAVPAGRASYRPGGIYRPPRSPRTM